jgi:hypothetical protein
MKETQLKELQGASRLTLGFFNRLIRRIECTKPLAGAGIILAEQENGIEITIGGIGSLADLVGYSAVTMNVCSNGVPTTILVLGKPLEE